MAAPAPESDAHAESNRNKVFDKDPSPVTEFDSVEDIGVLRLRHYAPPGEDYGLAPVVIVYSLFKRPFILDLAEDRSVIRSFLQRGQHVYLVDWRAPGPDDARCGFDAYVSDLTRAIDRVRERSGAPRVSITGICFGGLLSVIYAALNPESVRQLVPIAVGIERRPLIPPVVIEQAVLMSGNIPSWWIRGALNARVPAAPFIHNYLADELDEPELAELHNGRLSPLCEKLERWIYSDQPFAGQLARDIMGHVYWDGQLAAGSLRVNDQRVDLGRIHCPVLNISGTRDKLVPPQSTMRLVQLVSSNYARNFSFPATHMGLMASRAAHDELWPRVSMWLKLID